MRVIRLILWAVVAVATMALGYLYFMDNRHSVTQSDGGKLGGEFSLLRHDGQPITDKDLLGKPHAIFFGFTNCPEVCPSTLYEMSTWLAELGDDADKINAYFITVDPARDNVEVLSEYMSLFDANITGITGKKADVEKTLRSYRVFFKRQELEDGEYTMDHTATIFLLDAKGRFVRSIDYGENAETAVAKLRKMIGS